jgi:hypothetical protein
MGHISHGITHMTILTNRLVAYLCFTFRPGLVFEPTLLQQNF